MAAGGKNEKGGITRFSVFLTVKDMVADGGFYGATDGDLR